MEKRKIIFLVFVADLFLIYGLIAAISIIKFDRWRKAESVKILKQSQKEVDLKERIFLLQKASILYPTEESYLPTGIALMESGNDTLAGTYLKRVKTKEGFFQLALAYYKEERLPEAKKAIIKSLEQGKTGKGYVLLGKIYLKENNPKEANQNFFDAQKFENSEDNRFLVALTSLITKENYNSDDLGVLLSKDPQTVINRAYAYLKSNSYPQLAFSFLVEKGKNEQLNRDGYLYLANEYIEHNQDENAYKALLNAKAVDPYFPQTYQQLVSVGEKLGKTNEIEAYKKFLRSLAW